MEAYHQRLRRRRHRQRATFKSSLASATWYSDRDRSVVRLERISHVVERRRLDDDAEGSDQTRGGEHPQKHAVQHHRNELPVLLHLK